MPTALAAQTPPQSGVLDLRVADFTGGILVGAAVTLQDAGSGEVVNVETDEQGEIEIDGLAPGAYILTVVFPGFEPYIDSGLTIEPGRTELDVTLELAAVASEVTVARDPREAATDPRGDSMTTTLSEEDLELLPEDEEDLRQMLSDLAGADAEFAVDGFVDGEMPSRSQIQEIRIRRNLFSADQHGRGRSRVEVITRPGTERWRSTISFGFRDDALDARNAFSPVETPQQRKQASVEVEGPLVPNRTSISVEVEGESAYDTDTIVAATPDGSFDGVVRQPSAETDVSVGLKHALTGSQMLRIDFGRNDGEDENLGVGGFDVLERAYSQRQTRHWLRAGSTGALAGRFYNEVGVQARWSEIDSLPETFGPAVRIPDTLTTGGASVSGGRFERSIELHEKLDVPWRSHTFSAGGLFTWSRYDSDETDNANGTFTFNSLEAFEAGLPTTFTAWRGDPRVAFSMFRGAVFLQGDFRIREDLSLGVGVRQEWQSFVDRKLNLAPRIGATWSPAEDGRTTIRVGAGVFHDWYEASTYEETLQVDGLRGQEIIIESPGYPDPFGGGRSPVVLPFGRVQQSPDLELPTIREAFIGTERRLGESFRLDLSYFWGDGFNQLRARNVNAPLPDGTRPDPNVGNVIEIRSIGHSREHTLRTGFNGRFPWRSAFFAVRYSWEHNRDDGGGAMSLPADNDNPDEWGPASNDVRHQAYVMTSLDIVPDLRLSVNMRAESAPPYTITTGRDDNGDTVFNDRPLGIGRNSARGEGEFRMDVRLTWQIGIGARSTPAGGGAREQRGRGGRSRDPEYRAETELYLRAYNVLNTVNYTRFRGALTSPFFGMPTGAQAARRIEIGTRVRF